MTEGEWAERYEDPRVFPKDRSKGGEDGEGTDVIVIGPECFAKDESVICWKGQNYERQSDYPPVEQGHGTRELLNRYMKEGGKLRWSPSGQLWLIQGSDVVARAIVPESGHREQGHGLSEGVPTVPKWTGDERRWILHECPDCGEVCDSDLFPVEVVEVSAFESGHREQGLREALEDVWAQAFSESHADSSEALLAVQQTLLANRAALSAPPGEESHNG